jgi:GT2 family glycosyltransferase
MHVSKGISVVIPTCGPATHLMSVLAGLAKQTNRNFDAMVVDNNPLPRWHSRFLQVDDLRVALVREPRNGLSHARNAGVANSGGSSVAFLDDDGVPAATWVQNLVDGLQRYGSAAVGGSVELKLPRETPVWLGGEERALLSELLYLGDDIPTLADDMYIVGANMCITREAFDLVGTFSSDFGRTSKSLRSSEELEFTRRLQTAGHRVSFIASARVYHQIDEFRLAERYFVSRSYWQGRSDALLEAKWGRPASFGNRDLGVNLKILLRRLRQCLFAVNGAERVRRRLRFAREYGYFLQAVLLRFNGVQPPREQ